MKRIMGEAKSGQGLRRSDSTCVFYRALPHPSTGYLRDNCLLNSATNCSLAEYYCALIEKDCQSCSRGDFFCVQCSADFGNREELPRNFGNFNFRAGDGVRRGISEKPGVCIEGIAAAADFSDDATAYPSGERDNFGKGKAIGAEFQC